jgi:hypothetical protein
MHPLREARRHYVMPAVDALPSAESGAPLRALDIGFGRGMNAAALLAWASRAGRDVDLLGFEPAAEALGPWPRRPPRGADFPWWGALPGRWALDSGTVEVRAARVEDGLRPDDGRFHLVLLDLFSPRAVPEAWSAALFAALTAAAAPGAVLATYTCARTVREGLTAHGWAVEVLRRPRVRDTLRATHP